MSNVRRSKLASWLAVLATILLSELASAAEPPPPSVTLLVHGIKFDLAAPVDVWGRQQRQTDGTLTWTGMIGHLQRAGHRFGGTLKLRGAKVQSPNLNPRATLFALEFSDGANVDGLAYKTLELAVAVAELKRITGCQKVSIVAHSAGGLVARTYIQSALPGIAYAGDVDRLITISTPHLGSALAEHLGDFLGTRATALAPGGELVRRLNDELELPSDVLLASIVVRGVGTGVAALDFPSSAYEPYLDRDFLAGLPIDYRRGGDQVVDVRSQNLRLARTAARYEAANGRPVLYLLARVADPSPADRSLVERRVHEVAPGDPWACLWTELLLDARRRCWSPLDEPLKSRWIELQASLCAFGIVEEHVSQQHRFSEVSQANVDQLSLVQQRDSLWQFHFSGRGHLRPKLLGSATQTDSAAGLMELRFDRFGRIISERHALASDIKSSR